jgi:hypothetical protein
VVDTKETNPKDAVAAAQGRLQFSVIPWRAVPRMPATPSEWVVYTEVALAMAEGAWKYGRHNYRVAGVRASVYFDAAMRHLVALELGEEIDPDSGVHHYAKALAGLLVLRDAIIGGMCTDDRPPCCDGLVVVGGNAMQCLQIWWDLGADDGLEHAIDALVSARADEWEQAPGSGTARDWREFARYGTAKLRERMGDTPHTPPYTAAEVAATQHDTEPPSTCVDCDECT